MYRLSISMFPKTVERWETENAVPKGKELLRLAEEFGVNAHWLLTGQGKPFIIKDLLHDDVKISDELDIKLYGPDGQLKDHSVVDSQGKEGLKQPEAAQVDPFASAVSGLKAIFDGADPDKVYKTCLKIYDKAKKKRPGKNERDYLKLVLLTKPPYDYQLDTVIDEILNSFETIEDLAGHIATFLDPDFRDRQAYPWESRERNLKFMPEIKLRNNKFFAEFWG